MLDALKTLVVERSSCCRFYDIIVGEPSSRSNTIESSSPTGVESSEHLDSESAPEAQATGAAQSAGSINKQRVDGNPAVNDKASDEDPSVDDDEDVPFDFPDEFEVVMPPDLGSLNDSQREAIGSWNARLSLIWGPPGMCH